MPDDSGQFILYGVVSWGRLPRGVHVGSKIPVLDRTNHRVQLKLFNKIMFC